MLAPCHTLCCDAALADTTSSHPPSHALESPSPCPAPPACLPLPPCSVVVLSDIHIDIMDYIVPAACPDVQFRSMWAEFEWENKVAVNTSITEPAAFLDHIIASTNMVSEAGVGRGRGEGGAGRGREGGRESCGQRGGREGSSREVEQGRKGGQRAGEPSGEGGRRSWCCRLGG